MMNRMKGKIGRTMWFILLVVMKWNCLPRKNS